MFHGKLLCERRRGTFSLVDVGNMDQTPLPFLMNDGKTYNQTESKEIWCASGSSGLEKQQCTVQLMIFADGVSRVRPLVIFRGKGLRIKAEEKRKWDKRGKVLFLSGKCFFQENVVFTLRHYCWKQKFYFPLFCMNIRTNNHMFGRAIADNLSECIFENFKIFKPIM